MVFLHANDGGRNDPEHQGSRSMEKHGRLSKQGTWRWWCGWHIPWPNPHVPLGVGGATECTPRSEVLPWFRFVYYIYPWCSLSIIVLVLLWLYIQAVSGWNSSHRWLMWGHYHKMSKSLYLCLDEFNAWHYAYHISDVIASHSIYFENHSTLSQNF